MKGSYWILDGIDGSGKSALIDELKKHLKAQGKNIFDLTSLMRCEGYIPPPEQLSSYDAIFANEPTYAYAGRAIREELILASHKRIYPPKFISEGYSVDRGVLDMRVTRPILEMGISMVKDRGVTTIAYQVAQGVSLDFLLSLQGNQIALETPPDVIVIADCPIEVALRRLKNRFGKQDDAIFERRDFLEKVDSIYKSKWFREIFESRGTRIIYFDTNRDLESETKEFISIYDSLAKKK